MCYFLVISIHEAHNVFLVKGSYVYTVSIVEIKNKISILNDKHPFGPPLIYHIICKTLLVLVGKLILCVSATLSFIRWDRHKDLTI